MKLAWINASVAHSDNESPYPYETLFVVIANPRLKKVPHYLSLILMSSIRRVAGEKLAPILNMRRESVENLRAYCFDSI